MASFRRASNQAEWQRPPQRTPYSHVAFRQWADTLRASMVFAVGDGATLPDCLRGGRTPSPRAVQRSARRTLKRSNIHTLR